MTQNRSEDTGGLTATTPDHHLDCFGFNHFGKRHYQGSAITALCPTCYGSLLIGEDCETLATTNGLVVDYGGGFIWLRREEAAIVIRTQEVRHLVDTEVQAAGLRQQPAFEF